MTQSDKTIHTCGFSFVLSQSSKFGASLSFTEEYGGQWKAEVAEDYCINHLPDGFQCTLPDGTAWAAKSGKWFQLSGNGCI